MHVRAEIPALNLTTRRRLSSRAPEGDFWGKETRDIRQWRLSQVLLRYPESRLHCTSRLGLFYSYLDALHLPTLFYKRKPQAVSGCLFFSFHQACRPTSCGNIARPVLTYTCIYLSKIQHPKVHVFVSHAARATFQILQLINLVDDSAAENQPRGNFVQYWHPPRGRASVFEILCWS